MPTLGVFDSGLGGLTVLAALHRRLPDAALLYVADSAHAPYGERDRDYVVGRSLALTGFLLDHGAQAVVVACNTATALAIDVLRARWPDVPFVGVEPAVKPALTRRGADAPSGPVGVLATPATLTSARFAALLRAHRGDAEVVLQPCPGLAEAIETGGPHDPRTLELVRRLCQPLRAAGCASVVLGCTHYPLVADAIRAALGRDDLQLLDPAQAVAEQAARIAAALPPTAAAAPRAWSSGDPALLRRVARACGLPELEVLPLPAAAPAPRPPEPAEP